MIELTTAARNRLDRYLSDLRSTLAGCPHVNSGDVESDVMQHIETSLGAAAVPVDVPALADVLERLGSPSQWIPEEELSWMRRQLVRGRQAFERLRSGPEDFRLAYLSVTFLAVAALLLAAPPILPLVCIALSFLFARSALAMATTPAELRAQRWLLYPTLVIVYGHLIAGLMVWTVFPPIVWATETRLEEIHLPAAGGVPMWMFASYTAVAGTSLWWLFVGVLSWRRPALVRQVFYPFANRFRGAHGLWFSMISLLTFAATAVAGGLVLYGWRPWDPFLSG